VLDVLMDLGESKGVMSLSERHRAILRAIGPSGATESALGAAARSRELDELARASLVAYWPLLGVRPRGDIVGGDPGTWCLTFAGATAMGLPALRLAAPA
jgi:hypothetical protein